MTPENNTNPQPAGAQPGFDQGAQQPMGGQVIPQQFEAQPAPMPSPAMPAVQQPDYSQDTPQQPMAGQVMPPQFAAQQAPILPQAQTTAQPVPLGVMVPKKKFGRLGLPVIIAGVVFVLAGSGAAAYFGYIVPNKPENVWKTALKNTAEGYNTLVGYQQNNKAHTTAVVKGSYKVSGAFATDGTIDAKADTKTNNADIKFDVGAVTSRINVEARVIGSANSKNPDIYIKASGFKGLSSALGQYGPMLDGLDGQWIAVDHTLLDNLESSALSGSGSSVSPTNVTDLTQDDLAQIYKAVGDVDQQYLLTTDTNKAVLTVVKTVGKEKQDGRTVYHYQVGLNKQHTKDYANALVDRLQNTPLSKVLDGKKLRDSIDMNSVISAIDKIKDSDTADVYVDTGTKLIRTVRFTDAQNTQTYVELKMPYLSGDQIPLTLTMHDVSDSGEASIATLGFNVNGKKDTADVNIDIDVPGSAKGDKHTIGNVKLSVTGSTDTVTVDKPTGAKSLNEIIGQLMGGTGTDNLFGGAGSASSVTDYSTLLSNTLSL
jgi:hypothetical protein